VRKNFGPHVHVCKPATHKTGVDQFIHCYTFQLCEPSPGFLAVLIQEKLHTSLRSINAVCNVPVSAHLKGLMMSHRAETCSRELIG
jgi:hypothetical protein